MKNKFKIELFAMCDSIDMIVRVISKHNSGECTFTLEDLQTFLRMYKNIYPISTASLGYFSEDGHTLNISGDGGKTIGMSITNCEVYELTDTF